MSAGIRPSSDKPVNDYYFQPWWMREILRIIEILPNTDISILSDKDKGSLKKLRETLDDVLP